MIVHPINANLLATYISSAKCCGLSQLYQAIGYMYGWGGTKILPSLHARKGFIQKVLVN